MPPFDHEWIITGQGTVALELLEQVRDLDTLLVQVGGGGLLSGSAIAAKALNPAIRVFGVEPEAANDTYLSMRAGHRVEIPPPDTIADGLRPPKPGALTFPVIQRLVEDVLLVTEDEIRSAVSVRAEQDEDGGRAERRGSRRSGAGGQVTRGRATCWVGRVGRQRLVVRTQCCEKYLTHSKIARAPGLGSAQAAG